MKKDADRNVIISVNEWYIIWVYDLVKIWVTRDTFFDPGITIQEDYKLASIMIESLSL